MNKEKLFICFKYNHSKSKHDHEMSYHIAFQDGNPICGVNKRYKGTYKFHSNDINDFKGSKHLCKHCIKIALFHEYIDQSFIKKDYCCSNCGFVIDEQYFKDKNYREKKHVNPLKKEYKQYFQNSDLPLSMQYKLEEDLAKKENLIRIGQYCPNCFHDLIHGNINHFIPPMIEKEKWIKLKEIVNS